MTPWSAAEGNGSPSPWPRTASTAHQRDWARPRSKWTSLSFSETASTKLQKPVRRMDRLAKVDGGGCVPSARPLIFPGEGTSYL